MKRAVCLVATLAALTSCKDRPQVQAPVDAGLLCGVGQKLLQGECRFVCARDADCETGKRCNLFTGSCEPRPALPDSGVPTMPCTTGAERCSLDNKQIQRCGAEGRWEVKEACPPPSGYCLNEKCLACQPGASSCVSGNNKVVSACLDDGSGTRTVSCAGAGVCSQGECRECAPSTTRCAPDGAGGQVAQSCQRTGDEALLWKWTPSGDSFDGTCITRQCQAGPPARCAPPACFPGVTQCKNTTTQQVCGQTGSWGEVVCASLPGYTSGAECQNGVCTDECVEAKKAKSYFGCEYWTAVQDNSMDTLFKGGTSSGQGSASSSFAFVVANRSVSPASVEVWRHQNGAPVKVSTTTVQGRNDGATKGLAVIYVPWQSIGPSSNPIGVASTGSARYAYKISSTRPVTVYQFNPLDATKTFSKSCKPSGLYAPRSSDCNHLGSFTNNPFDPNAPATWGICENNNTCRYNTYSNDASLLLPAHILGTSHVVMSEEHVAFTMSQNQPPGGDGNGHVTIVGTEDNTTVTFKSSARTKAGGGVASLNKGEVRSFTLRAYDVLQIATDNLGASYIECANNPYGGSGKVCRVDNDLTGSVITSNKPIAVFGGAACAGRPYDRVACDHLEEQIFPFSTWGKKFVAVRSHPLRLEDGSFATNSPPDLWKIVAACPASQCPSGTLLTFSTPPTDVIPGPSSAPNRCASGSLAANNCRVAGGTYVEFKSSVNFTVTADQPIAVAQFFPGQGSTAGFNPPAQGDPSFVLLPPAEQWRANYTVLAAPGIKDNYLAIAIDDSQVASVEVDGVAVSGFVSIAGSPYKVKNHPVPTGTHTINVAAKPGISPLPGAGVTVYGYDAFVSYGYTGGLDLGTIVTGIDPGG